MNKVLSVLLEDGQWYQAQPDTLRKGDDPLIGPVVMFTGYPMAGHHHYQFNETKKNIMDYTVPISAVRAVRSRLL